MVCDEADEVEGWQGPDGSSSGPIQVDWNPLLYFQLLEKDGWNIADFSVTPTKSQHRPTHRISYYGSKGSNDDYHPRRCPSSLSRHLASARSIQHPYQDTPAVVAGIK